jgi:UDP-glucose 4-epimerase
MHLLIVGAGGLLGSALAREAKALNHKVTVCTGIAWDEPETARVQLKEQMQQFLKGVSELDARESRDSSESSSCSWGIIWASGKVTTASSAEEAQIERDFFTNAMHDLAGLLSERDSIAPGAFLLASSAGGIYAGSANPPFDSQSDPHPLGTYGDLKLAQEKIAHEGLGNKLAVLIARVANLYGPGQDLSKLQGLISRLALSGINREPLTMFVPLDTLRDYIFADDAAQSALHWLSALKPHEYRVRVIASGEPTSLGHLIGLMQDIARTRLPVAYGIHASAAAQSHDLRLVPDQDDAIRALARVSLPAGMKSVYLDILNRHQQGVGSRS